MISSKSKSHMAHLWAPEPANLMKTGQTSLHRDLLLLLLWTISSSHPFRETWEHEEQPHPGRHLLGLPVPSYCCGEFYQLLPSLLAVWITAREASLFQHLQEMQLSCAGRRAQSDHGGRMWALCQLHCHSKPGMADVYSGDRCRLCAATPGSTGCCLRMLHGGTHL